MCGNVYVSRSSAPLRRLLVVGRGEPPRCLSLWLQEVVREGARCAGQIALAAQPTQAACALAAAANGSSFFVWEQANQSCAAVPGGHCMQEARNDSLVLSSDCNIGLFGG